jgi:hypothetical protein
MRKRSVYAFLSTRLLTLSPQEYGEAGGTDLSRGHGDNKILSVWLSKEDYEKLKKLLDQLSDGDSFSERLRSFFHWLVKLPEGVSVQTAAQRKQEIEEQKSRDRFVARTHRQRSTTLFCINF